jgi:rare lipoprotein A
MGRAGVGTGLSVVARIGVIVGCCLALAHCAKAPGTVDPKYGVSSSPRVVQLGEPVPKGGGYYRVGRPYTIGGQTYSPEETSNYSAEGIASWYGEDFHGRLTANREVYDMNSISAAHPTLPIPSYARVTNLANGRSIIVRVNDRGPFHQSRLIDVSVRTAKLLGFHDNGIARVRVDYVGKAALTGSDDTKLAATLRRGTPAPGPAEVQVASAAAFPFSISQPARGPVPTPAERPYELGQEGAQRTAARPPSEASAVARRPLPAPSSERRRPSPAPRQANAADPAPNFDARFAPAMNAPVVAAREEPVSAYAPSARNGAVVTGRGLY